MSTDNRYFTEGITSRFYIGDTNPLHNTSNLIDMINTSEFLKSICEFETKVVKRAAELLKATGYEYGVTKSSVQYKESSVGVKLRELTNYDYPDYPYIELDLYQINMSDTEWDLYIQNTTLKTEEKKQMEKDNLEKKKLADKQREFEKLKIELGL